MSLDDAVSEAVTLFDKYIFLQETYLKTFLSRYDQLIVAEERPIRQIFREYKEVLEYFSEISDYAQPEVLFSAGISLAMMKIYFRDIRHDKNMFFRSFSYCLQKIPGDIEKISGYKAGKTREDTINYLYDTLGDKFIDRLYELIQKTPKDTA